MEWVQLSKSEASLWGRLSYTPIGPWSGSPLALLWAGRLGGPSKNVYSFILLLLEACDVCIQRSEDNFQESIPQWGLGLELRS